MIHLVTPSSHKHLYDTLWSGLPGPKYATAGEIDVSEFPMPASILVDGVNLALPLSHNDFSNLRKTACAQTSGVRHAWEVDASKVSCPQMPEFFSKVVPDLAVHAVRAMGLDDRALGVEVRLHKLFLHEQDGQLDLYKDAEKEDGIFARMIVQLPTELGHKGGKLELCHGKKSVTVDFSGAKSSTGYFSTVFFSDCEHQPAKLETGSRLCLVFRLTRNNSKFMDVSVVALPHYISALVRVETFFKNWVDDPSLRPLAISLSQKYSKDNMSFAGLSGHDRIVAELVLNCASFLDVHLCMLVRKHDGYKERNKLKHWIQPDGTKLFKSAAFEVANINDNGGPFNPEETVHTDCGYESGPEYSRSSVAVLVLWPKDRMIEVLGSHVRQCSMPEVLRCLEEQHKLKPERTSDSFQQYLTVLDHGHTDPKAIKDLLEFCLQHDLRDGAFMVMRKWSLDLIENYSHSIISTIWKYGWADCYSEVLWELFEEPNIDAKQNIGNFPKHLLNRGLQDAAVCAARQLLKKTNIQSSFSFQRSLLEFLLESELEDETLYFLSVLTDSLCFCPYLAKVVKLWGERAFTPIEEFWQRKLKASTKANKQKKKEFLRAFAEFVCHLQQEGCHDAAVVFGRKNFIDPGEIYGGNKNDKIDDTDALVLLFCREERFHETVRLKIGSHSLTKLVVKMREVAGVIGLLEDGKVMGLFMELLSQAVEREDFKSDLVEMVCWLVHMVHSGSAADGLAEPGKVDSPLSNEVMKGCCLENNLPVPPRQHPKFRRRRCRRHPNSAAAATAEGRDQSSSPGQHLRVAPPRGAAPQAIFTALLIIIFIIFFSFYYC